MKEQQPANWDSLEAAMNRVRDALDNADDTPLGRISALLDGMARDVDTAIAIAKRLRS